MCTSESHPESASVGFDQLSTDGSFTSENDIFTWSNSFFEIKKLGQDEEELVSKCDKRKKILESLKSRKDVLHKEMAHLQEQHLSQKDFLKSSKSKDTDQMLKKAEDKKKEVVSLEAERQRLSEEMQQLQQKKFALELQVHSHSVFHDFMKQVVEISQFEEVQDQVDHLESLLHFREQLSERDSCDHERINTLRTELVTFRDNHHLSMVRGRNQLSDLQTELEKTRSETFSWEQKWKHIEETAAEKTLILGKIKMATLNLYEMTGSSLDNGRKSVDENDTETQLNKIQEFILDHTEIVKENLLTKENIPDDSSMSQHSNP